MKGSKKKPAPKPRGPKADRLVIDGKWGDAITKALEKKRPPEGWPNPANPKS